MPVDHYENFPVASLLLPAKLRRPIEVIYRFARSADDIADEGDAEPAERLAGLAAYQAELDRIAAGQAPHTALFIALAEVIAQHRLPIQLFRDLLDAFAQDVDKQRYADYPELLDYCRRSANPVGRLVLYLFGRTEPEHLEQSDCICSALQLINFWQDVAVDWGVWEGRQAGRSSGCCDGAGCRPADMRTTPHERLLLFGSRSLGKFGGESLFLFAMQGDTRPKAGIAEIRRKRPPIF